LRNGRNGGPTRLPCSGEAEGRAAVESLGAAVASVAARGGDDRAEPTIASVQAQFEGAVETFAGDGFRYRRSVGTMVADEFRRSSIVLGLAVLAALGITVLLTKHIAPPVRNAVRIAQAIAAGRLDNTITITGRGETTELLRALSIMQSSIPRALARIHALMNDQAIGYARELAAQHARLEAAFDNMNQGLCLFGADGCRAVTNRRFVEMFGRPQAGAPADTVLHEAGLQLLIESAGDDAVAALSCELPDGRSIAVSRQAVASGGWGDIAQRGMSSRRPPNRFYGCGESYWQQSGGAACIR
jgi:nitrogen fixation/metabolism regulation signal transduction histidine kinase